MSGKRARRLAVWAIVALIAATLLPPFINANRFRNRLVDTIQRSIGRPVNMGDVHFTLLPRPGFVISNFSVTDDPAFSAEPVLRAESVSASLRLTSLWRGRLEISRLSFDLPSLNLVRSAEGRWNVQSILRQASQVRAAPTAAPRPEVRPRFPYIEASNGRINFREGQEKLPHALMDADFSLWLESEDQWNMRLEARPTRTDASLRDTGNLRLSGQIRRAETLALTPLSLEVELENAQLGQWTTLLTGRDHGWRGSTDLQAELKGTVSDLAFTANIEVSDFHRHDIATGDALEARITCKGSAFIGRASAAGMTDLDCAMPLGGGAASLRGKVSFARNPDYDLKASFRAVPMSSFANLYRRVKRDVPPDLTAEGSFTGDYSFVRTSTTGFLSASGEGRVTGLRLDSDSRNASLFFAPFDVGFPRLKKLTDAPELIVGPAGIRLGGAMPVYVSAHVTMAGILAEAKGDADLNQLLLGASIFGLADPRYKASGLANINLTVQGPFTDSTPVVMGSAQLRQVTTLVDGVAAPLLVQSASLQLGPDALAIQKLSARLEGTNTIVEGSLAAPRNCPSSAGCESTFDLKTAELNLDDLNRLLNPRYRSPDWLSLPLQMFGSRAVKTSRLMTLQSRGRVAIGRLVVKNIIATRANAEIVFAKGKITVSAFEADLLSGKHKGTWQADLTGSEPVFLGKGTVDALPLAHLNALLRSPLGTGTVALTYELKLQGADAESLRRSAAGTAAFRWTNGSWRTEGLSPAVQFTDWSGKLNIRDEIVDLTSSVMQVRGDAYLASGRVTFDRELSLRLRGTRDQMVWSGTLQNASLTIEPVDALPAQDSASNLKNATPRKARN